MAISDTCIEIIMLKDNCKCFISASEMLLCAFLLNLLSSFPFFSLKENTIQRRPLSRCLSTIISPLFTEVNYQALYQIQFRDCVEMMEKMQGKLIHV